MCEDELYQGLNYRMNGKLSRDEFIERLDLIKHIILEENTLKKETSNPPTRSSVSHYLEVFHHSFVEWSLDVKYCTQRFLCKLSDGHFTIALSLMNNCDYSQVLKDDAKACGRDYILMWHLLRSDLRFEAPAMALLLMYSSRSHKCSESTNIDHLPLSLLQANDTHLDQNVIEVLKMSGLSADSEGFDIMTASFSEGGLQQPSSMQDLFPSDNEDNNPATPPSKGVADSSNSLASAAFQGNFQLVQLLLEASGNAFLELIDPKTGQTPLMLASRQGHLEIVNALLDAGAQVDSTDFEGWTALKSASWGGHVECVRLLLAAGADPDVTDIGGRSALGAACWCGHEKVVSCLAQGGAQIDSQDDDGRSPLMSACYLGHFNVVQLLLAHNADPNLTDPDGRTALFVACSGLGQSLKSRFKVVEALLEAGASVTASDIDGITALTVAACEGRGDLCELLLENDADVDWEDVEGRTAIDWAVMMGQTQVVKVPSFARLIYSLTQSTHFYLRFCFFLQALNVYSNKHLSLFQIHAHPLRPYCSGALVWMPLIRLDEPCWVPPSLPSAITIFMN